MLRARKSKPVASSEEQGFNSSDVSRICGVSLRQLQWWDERKVVSPRQDGHKRVYMSEEVVEISVIAELRRAGSDLPSGPLTGPDWPERLIDALAVLRRHIIREQEGVFPAALATLGTEEWQRLEALRALADAGAV